MIHSTKQEEHVTFQTPYFATFKCAALLLNHGFWKYIDNHS